MFITTKKSKIIKYIIVIIIFLILSWVGFNEYTRIQINKRKSQYITDKVYSVTKTEGKNEVDSNEKIYFKEEIVKEYKGFDVIAKLEIPKIKLETYILKNFSEASLNVSVTKFWGSNPNQIGNMCVAGHNFKNKNMFRNLKNLKIGDTFTISDNDIGKIEYKIYDIYRVKPEDVSCLSQDTNNKKEVTLITCTSNSKERIIVKAREII
ncbi:MAG: sortase [Clostridia bacterium]|nr:sortase [Clostridia bacterium]